MRGPAQRHAPELDLFVPGLLGPVDASVAAMLDGQPRAALQPLQRLLRRARPARCAPGYLHALAERVGAQGLGAAAVTRLADGGTPDGACWLRADPVALQAGLDSATLLTADLDLSAAEVAELVAAANALLADRGLELEPLARDRWYLRLPDSASSAPPDAPPPEEQAGANIATALPPDREAKRWHALATELQMLLHQSAVNAAREAQGRRPINALWLWGAGRLPASGAWRPELGGVLADEPFARGLGIAAGVPVCPLAPSLAATDAAAVATALDRLDTQRREHAPNRPARLVVVLDQLLRPLRHGDLACWHTGLLAVSQTWLPALEQALRTGRLARLTLFAGRGQRYDIARGRLVGVSGRIPLPALGRGQRPSTLFIE